MLAQPPVWLIFLAFICAIGPLVFIHELGHYLVARCSGSAPRCSRSASAAKSLAGTTSGEPAGRSAGCRSAAMSGSSAMPMPRARASSDAPISGRTRRAQLPGQAGRPALPHRARRPDGQFPAGDPDLRGLFRDHRNAAHAQRGRPGRSREVPPSRPAFAPATASNSIAGQDTPTFEDRPPHRRVSTGRGRSDSHHRAAASRSSSKRAWARRSSATSSARRIRIGLLGDSPAQRVLRTSRPGRTAPEADGLHFVDDPHDDRRNRPDRHGLHLAQGTGRPAQNRADRRAAGITRRI